MVFSGLLRWWYREGWLQQLTDVRRSFIRIADQFSIGLLLKTLLMPFRQISADETSRGAGGLVNIIVDKLISRLIGCILRIIMMITGVIALTLLAVISGLRLLLWPLLPVMPLVGLILTFSVGAPWTLI